GRLICVCGGRRARRSPAAEWHPSIERNAGTRPPADPKGTRMGVLRTRLAPVGRPFKTGNPGGGRRKGAPNKATRNVKEFARDFLASDTYRANVKRRIMGGKAPHMEVLLHHYAFGKPKFQVGDAEVTSPQSQEISRRAEVLGT